MRPSLEWPRPAPQCQQMFTSRLAWGSGRTIRPHGRRGFLTCQPKTGGERTAHATADGSLTAREKACAASALCLVLHTQQPRSPSSGRR